MMPYRKTKIVTPELYHVFNRSVAQQHIFNSPSEYNRFYNLLNYYSFKKPDRRFSYFNRLASNAQGLFMSQLKLANEKLVEIHSFAIMPTHFHLLLRQLIDGGIATFLRTIQDSYAKYKNIKTKRRGALFQSMFKCNRIESDNILLHVVRYIHLNPVTDGLINMEELGSYPYTSFFDYVHNSPRQLMTTDLINSYYKSKQDLISFTNDQADYQRSLVESRHVLQDYESMFTPGV